MKSRRNNGVIAMLILLVGAVALAQAPAAGSGGESAPDPRALLRKLLGFQATVKSFICHGTCVIRSEGEGARIELLLEVNAAFERPHKAVLSYLGEGAAENAGQAHISDGRNGWTYQQKTNRYFVLPLDAMLEEAERERRKGIMGLSDLYPIMATDPGEVDGIMSRMRDVRYLGIKDLKGGKCHHFSFTQFDHKSASAAEIWISASEPTVIRRFTRDIDEMMDRNPPRSTSDRTRGMLRKMSKTMIVELEGWDVNTPLAADTFSFDPPEGAVKVGSRGELRD